MGDPTTRLGGRLPLLDPETLAGGQRHLYDSIEATMVPWAERVGLRGKTADGRLIGPFNPALFSPEIASAFLALQVVEEKNTALSERVRQVVILSIGSVWKASYELYAHAAAARMAGLSEDTISALAAGEPATDLNEQEQVAQRFSLHLARERGISDEFFQIRRFGEKGLVDMVMLAGCYHVVCSLLNAFAVPAPETEHDF